MKLTSIAYPEKEAHYNKVLLSETNAKTTTTLGTVFLKKGTRIPNKGFSRHPFNEISIIIEGCIEMLHEDNTVAGYLKKGTAVYINALEPQAGNVLEDTKLIYVLNALE